MLPVIKEERGGGGRAEEGDRRLLVVAVSAVGQNGKSSSSFSVIKPEQRLFFPANYVEIAKTIKHLVVILPLSDFSQYCDRLMHCV